MMVIVFFDEDGLVECWCVLKNGMVSFVWENLDDINKLEEILFG